MYPTLALPIIPQVSVLSPSKKGFATLKVMVSSVDWFVVKSPPVVKAVPATNVIVASPGVDPPLPLAATVTLPLLSTVIFAFVYAPAVAPLVANLSTLSVPVVILVALRVVSSEPTPTKLLAVMMPLTPTAPAIVTAPNNLVVPTTSRLKLAVLVPMPTQPVELTCNPW